MSELILVICKELGARKINTSAYHPQNDGLVEKFNSTLINMTAKCCEKQYLPYLLFAYGVSVQESTNCKELLFFLLYGRDPRIPTESAVISYQEHK